MDKLLSNLTISVPAKIYLKDPQSSSLGHRIVENGIVLIHEIGFESFTFKKLGARIGSNESSIYRYFESKHHLLLYLTSWYWAWLEYQLVLETYSLSNPREKLKKAIKILTRTIKKDSTYTHINEMLLNQIIVNESSKSFLTKEVDRENKEGYFIVYKRLVSRLKEMIIAVDASYPYPASLASTVVEGALHQHFLKDHFTSITDCNTKNTPTEFFLNLIFNLLK